MTRVKGFIDKLIFALAACFLALPPSGCLWRLVGDHNAWMELTVTLPSPDDQPGGSPVSRDSGVQEAQRIINEVFARNGLKAQECPGPVDVEQYQCVAIYPYSVVALKSNRLYLSFTHRHSSHFTPPVKKTISELTQRLTARYGSESVTAAGRNK